MALIVFIGMTVVALLLTSTALGDPDWSTGENGTMIGFWS
jgi:hypothetical protein